MVQVMRGKHRIIRGDYLHCNPFAAMLTVWVLLINLCTWRQFSQMYELVLIGIR